MRVLALFFSHYFVKLCGRSLSLCIEYMYIQMVFNKSTDNETTEPHQNPIIYIIFFLFLYLFTAIRYLSFSLRSFEIVFNIKINFYFFRYLNIHRVYIFRCDFDYVLLFDFFFDKYYVSACNNGCMWLNEMCHNPIHTWSQTHIQR